MKTETENIKCFKVVDEDLKSLCLAGNKKKISYTIGEWISEPDPVEGPGLDGGLLSYNYLSDAKWLAGYVKNHPNPEIRKNPRIFNCLARGILHRRYRKRGSLYTLKSREIILMEELI